MHRMVGASLDTSVTYSLTLAFSPAWLAGGLASHTANGLFIMAPSVKSSSINDAYESRLREGVASAAAPGGEACSPKPATSASPSSTLDCWCKTGPTSTTTTEPRPVSTTKTNVLHCSALPRPLPPPKRSSRTTSPAGAAKPAPLPKPGRRVLLPLRRRHPPPAWLSLGKEYLDMVVIGHRCTTAILTYGVQQHGRSHRKLELAGQERPERR
eukprot:scaffold17526_cov64-Phaeocystis_antarctica.AAC.3